VDTKAMIVALETLEVLEIHNVMVKPGSILILRTLEAVRHH
jgi:hypothetical protein